MKSILLDREAEHRRTFAFAFEQEENPVEGLARAAAEFNLASCRITAVGGFSTVTLGYFDRAKCAYSPIAIDEQVEVLSLLGDLAHEGERCIVHVHCIVGLRNGKVRGGHLLEARVWPTLEVLVTEWPVYLRKRFDPRIGLALIDPPTPGER